MADCPSCGGALKDGDWTCGVCGAPVAGAGIGAAPGGDYDGGGADARPDPYAPASGWAPEYAAQPASAAAAPADAGPSGLLRLVVIIAVIAIIAIVAVWFFVLRGPGTTGDEFLGTWTATAQQGIGTAVVERTGDDAFLVTLSGSNQAETVAVPARLDGTELVITMDDFSQIAGDGNSEGFKEALKALAGDFRIVFTSVDATHLDLRIVGTSAAGQDFDQTIPLVQAAPGTT